METSKRQLAVAVRPYATTDQLGVRELLQKTFGTAMLYDCFADGNPLGPFIGAVADHDGHVVGFNMWNAWLVHSKEGSFTAYQSGASAVHDSMRGQGIFARLLRAGEDIASERGVPFFFGFPNPASLPSFLRAGWTQIDTLHMYGHLLPALGLGRIARRQHDATLPDLGEQARFVSWRYRRAGIAALPVLTRDGETILAFARPQGRSFARLHKLLDVVDTTGRRRPEYITAAVASLDGPGLTVARIAPHPGLPWLHLRRSWDTPLIIKRLHPEAGPSGRVLHGASWWFGDIDAS